MARCTLHTRTHSTGNSRNSWRFSCRSFRIAHQLCCQHIQEAVYSEVGGKLAGISTSWDPDFLATFWTRYDILTWTCLMNTVQTFKTEAVQARQLFWLGKGAHTHRTGYLIMKIIEQSLNIHTEQNGDCDCDRRF